MYFSLGFVSAASGVLDESYAAVLPSAPAIAGATSPAFLASLSVSVAVGAFGAYLSDRLGVLAPSLVGEAAGFGLVVSISLVQIMSDSSSLRYHHYKLNAYMEVVSNRSRLKAK